MPTTVPNLTKSSARIYLIDPNNVLEDIYWETINEISKTGEPILTSNGINKYYTPTRPEVQPIELSKAANTEEDKIIANWVDNFCNQTEIIQGANSGTILMIVPLKNCAVDEFHAISAKCHNVIPIGYRGWDFDLLNKTDMSRFTLQITCTDIEIS